MQIKIRVVRLNIGRLCLIPRLKCVAEGRRVRERKREIRKERGKDRRRAIEEWRDIESERENIRE